MFWGNSATSTNNSNSEFVDSDNAVTIFAFLDAYRAQAAASDADITALAAAEDINGTGQDASGETNDGGLSTVLPVFKPITVGGAAVEVCSNDNFGTYNRLGNRQYLSLDITSTATYTFTMTRTSGDTDRDPDFLIYGQDTLLATGIAGPAESETLAQQLTAGTYWIETRDDRNISDGLTSGDACYDFTVQ